MARLAMDVALIHISLFYIFQDYITHYLLCGCCGPALAPRPCVLAACARGSARETARRAARASAAAEMGLVDAWELPGRTVPASAPRSTILRITWKRYSCSRIHTLREARKRQHVLCLHKSWQPGALAGQGCSPDVATTETLQRIQLL